VTYFESLHHDRERGLGPFFEGKKGRVFAKDRSGRWCGAVGLRDVVVGCNLLVRASECSQHECGDEASAVFSMGAIQEYRVVFPIGDRKEAPTDLLLVVIKNNL
jgi:hypothetical protein